MGIVALLIASESVLRFVDPRQISFDQAIGVAVIGLIVNVISAWLLRDDHHHGHDGHHHDHNLRAAYLHVLADALTSLAAIFALFSGRMLGWNWMDPLMGLVGSLVIGRWAYSLVRETAALLLDADIESEVVDALRSALQRDSSDLVSDLHVWHVGPGQLAAIAVIVTDAPRSPAEYKVLMQSAVELAHATVEVNRSSDGSGARVCAA